MKRIFSLLLAFSPAFLFAQETPISAGSFTGCGGFIVDSGLSAADYGANENFVMTVCAEDPETVINLYWNIFDLGEGDVLSIYDGEDTNAPLIGSYEANDLQTQDVFNSEANTSGCLTLEFTSDAADHGNFACEVSCGYPCERPIAVVSTGIGNPALVCPGQTVTFDATASTVAEGFEIISWEWDFGDGNTESGGPVVTHTYENAGAFRVDLDLTDNNECSNNNLADILVYVSTEPDFTGTSVDVEVCVGQEVDLTGAVTGVTWDAQPDPNFGGALFIPDDQSQCFTSDLAFSSFLPSQVVEDPADFESVYINFEHSFMGDLTMMLICPNGQSMVLHQQGGGGTYLGEPVDIDAQPNDPGVGYDYWWAPDAPNGTWADESFGVTTLPSGTYSTIQPWTNLEGCPLNGTWTIEICDLWGSDNGFIFDWGLFFDPELYPELISFTPTFGMQCDSTSWSGPSIIDTSADCNVITVQPSEPGTETYTFSATNNHGCTYEQTVNVIATQGPIAVTPEVVYYCGTAVNVNGSISNPQAGTDYSYTWSPAEFVSNPNNANTQVNNIDEEVVLTLTVAPSDAPECASSSDVLVSIPEEPVGFEPQFLEGCLGQTLFYIVPDQPAGWDYSITWYNITGEEPVIASDNEALQATQSGLYEAIIEMNDPCQYQASGQVDVLLEVCELGEIPNIITPNNDGTNDRFYIEGLEFFPGSTLKVYNRWGTMVFESENYRGNWSPSEDEASEGTYFFILTVAFPDSAETFTGDLTITRDGR